MTKRDYELIASAPADAHAQIGATAHFQPGQNLAVFYGHRLSCEALVTTLKANNSRFNREQFLAACTGASK
jgi:hypothetical protein